MVDVLAIGAHPDDCEFCCGGILAKMSAQGKSIVIVDLTIGQKGSNGSTSERISEGKKAANIIGAERVFLDFSDCELVDSYEGRLKVVQVIRNYKPKLLLAPVWKGQMNHPDHLACGLLSRYACRYARFKNILPDFPPHRVDGILHYLFPCQQNPDFLVDISDHVDTWKAMMAEHRSQLKTNDYIDWNVRAASAYGVMIGAKYAQALVKGNPVEVSDPMLISKGTIEI